MPTLKSVASVTTGEPDTFFSVIACSSVMASSLWRITSKVIGSIAPLPWGGVLIRGSFIGRRSDEIDGKIAGAVQACGLAGADVNGGLGMLDAGGPGNAKSNRHL